MTPRRWKQALPMLIVCLTAIAQARAETAWIKDEVHLQLRTGAGSNFRIIGQLKTGDDATIIERGDKWTQVRTSRGQEGWIPAGFLQPEPPARVALQQLESDAESLRAEVERLTRESAELRGTNEDLAGRDGGQRGQIDRLTRENYELRAGARWPEWITGAGIVLVGMLLGWALSRSAGRRRQQRIRL